MAELNTSRIAHAVGSPSAGPLAHRLVVQAGVGSGGMAVLQLLTQCGVQHWELYDPDTLDEVNLVKHSGHRSQLGQPKVSIGEGWVLDRNPQAKVDARMQDIRMNPEFEASIARASLVLCCVDAVATRQYLNDLCVRAQVPMVYASVFRRGVGGEVFAYIPGETGCFRCLEAVSESLGLNLGGRLEEEGPSEEESRQVYGLGEEEYKESGLSIDITTIAAMHSRLALAALIGWGTSGSMWSDANWVIVENRPWSEGLGGYAHVRKLKVRPQASCFCARREP